MPVLARDTLGNGDAFFFSLVRQHRPSDHIADRPNTRYVGTAVGIDFDGATLVQLQANAIAVQTLDVGHTTDRDDQLINAERLRKKLVGELEEAQSKLDKASTVFNVDRYIDTIVPTPEGLKFAERLCVYDSEMIPNAIIYPI